MANEKAALANGDYNLAGASVAENNGTYYFCFMLMNSPGYTEDKTGQSKGKCPAVSNSNTLVSGPPAPLPKEDDAADGAPGSTVPEPTTSTSGGSASSGSGSSSAGSSSSSGGSASTTSGSGSSSASSSYTIKAG